MKAFSAIAFVFGFLAAQSHATTFIYNLGDNSNGAIGDAEYGLRLDALSPDTFFSFEGDSTAHLTYDDVSLTASISGTVVENTVANDDLGEWQLEVTFNNVLDAGGGTFTANGGTVDLMDLEAPISSSLSFDIEGKSSMEDVYGFLFLNDGHRLGAGNTNAASGLSGRGWLVADDTNDFLFTATPVPVPVPAAGCC